MKQRITFIVTTLILMLSGILTLIAMNQEAGPRRMPMVGTIATPSPAPTMTPAPTVTPTPKPGDEPLPTPTLDPAVG